MRMYVIATSSEDATDGFCGWTSVADARKRLAEIAPDWPGLRLYSVDISEPVLCDTEVKP